MNVAMTKKKCTQICMQFVYSRHGIHTIYIFKISDGADSYTSHRVNMTVSVVLTCILATENQKRFYSKSGDVILA